MLDAWSERRRQELHEQGTVAAIAHHDPQGLQALDTAARDDEPVDDPIGEYRQRRKERDG